MTTMRERVAELERRRAKIRELGGEKRVAKQHALGRRKGVLALTTGAGLALLSIHLEGLLLDLTGKLKSQAASQIAVDDH